MQSNRKCLAPQKCKQHTKFFIYFIFTYSTIQYENSFSKITNKKKYTDQVLFSHYSNHTLNADENFMVYYQYSTQYTIWVHLYKQAISTFIFCALTIYLSIYLYLCTIQKCRKTVMKMNELMIFLTISSSSLFFYITLQCK